MERPDTGVRVNSDGLIVAVLQETLPPAADRESAPCSEDVWASAEG